MAAKQGTLVASSGAGEEQVQTYTYRARNSDGKVVSGRASATNPADVVFELQRRGLNPLKVKANGGGLNTDVKLRKSIKHRTMVITTRMLATMFDAGLPPLQVLDLAIRDCEDPVMKDALTNVRVAMQRDGLSMATAFSREPAFPPLIVNFLVAGEAAGSHRDAFARVADQYEAEDKLRTKVRKAMTYPAIVFGVALLVVIAMLLFIIPAFSNALLDVGGEGTELPLLTRVVTGSAAVFGKVFPFLAIALTALTFWYKANSRKEKVREIVDPIKFKLPVFGSLFHSIALARFSRNLSGLLQAGIERLEALEITAQTVGNITMERAIMAAREAQRQGQPLVEPLRAEPLFPNMLIQMVMVGEESGQTGQMLGRAADIYDRDVDVKTDGLTDAIGPLLMAVMGGFVAVVVLSIYLPYFSLLDAI